MVEDSWQEDIKREEEKWEKEKERQKDIDMIDLVDGVRHLYVDFGEIIYK